MIAGFFAPDEGEILVDGQVVNKMAPRKRRIGLVFQDYAVFSRLTVRANLAFGLESQGVPRRERDRAVAEISEKLDLRDILAARGGDLNMSEMQRVALARVLVTKPELLLLDEPMSNLDAALRASLRSELKQIQKELEQTVLYVTHDQVEALSMSDRIAVMRDGALLQVGDAGRHLSPPVDRFVAQFIGDPPINIVPCKVGRVRASCWVNTALHADLRLAGRDLSAGDYLLAVRPHAFQASREPREGPVRRGSSGRELWRRARSACRLWRRPGGGGGPARLRRRGRAVYLCARYRAGPPDRPARRAGRRAAAARGGGMSKLAVDRLSKSFGDVQALSELAFDVADGEFFCVVGPTNAGKSTLLKTIAGLHRPDSGRILLSGRDVTRLEPRHRNVSLLFQNIALFPTLSGRDNIAFPLRTAGATKARSRGGSRRSPRFSRSAICLTACRRPSPAASSSVWRLAGPLPGPRTSLMLDEPLTNLDARIRIALRIEFKALHRQLGQTLIYVTHDQVEAMSMSDRIAVLNKGRFEQIGTPDEVYHRPASAFVARFIGQPPMNIIEAELSGETEAPAFRPGFQLPIEGIGDWKRPPPAAQARLRPPARGLRVAPGEGRIRPLQAK